MSTLPTIACPECSTFYRPKLNEPKLISCLKCGAIIHDKTGSTPQPGKKQVPEDWSFVKIGTGGTWKNESFEVIGRIRLQLVNDYKNIWTALLPAGKMIWIIESFASFAVLQPKWENYNKDISKLKAGVIVPISEVSKFRGEYLEKCTSLTYEGENGDWRYLTSPFFLLQCSDPAGLVALIPIRPKSSVQYLSGEKVTADTLKLTNIITWNEWQ